MSSTPFTNLGSASIDLKAPFSKGALKGTLVLPKIPAFKGFDLNDDMKALCINLATEALYNFSPAAE